MAFDEILNSSSSSSSPSSSSSSSSSSCSSRKPESSTSGAKAHVEVKVDLPKAEVKASGKAKGSGSKKSSGGAKGGAKLDMNAAMIDGLNFSGAGNICISVGKILAIVAACLLFIAAIVMNVGDDACLVANGLTFWLICAFVVALLIMDLISKPQCVLKFFTFIHYPAGVMGILLILSFQMFSFCQVSTDGKYGYVTFAVIVTWIIVIYLLIITLLRGFGVF